MGMTWRDWLLIVLPLVLTAATLVELMVRHTRWESDEYAEAVECRWRRRQYTLTLPGPTHITPSRSGITVVLLLAEGTSVWIVTAEHMGPFSTPNDPHGSGAR